MAERRARAAAIRAAPGAGACLSPRAFLRGDRRDHELSGQHREDAHVPRAQETEGAAAGARRNRAGAGRMSAESTPGAAHAAKWDLIPWLVNGRLSGAEAAALRAHMENCTECAREY